MSPKRLVIAVALAALVALGGCVGTLGADGGPADTSTTTTTTTTTTTAGYGTQYLYVDPADGTHSVNDSNAVAFGNLSEARQEAFLAALETGRVEFEPHEDNPFDWNEDHPEFVRYEGQWYEVQVAIV